MSPGLISPWPSETPSPLSLQQGWIRGVHPPPPSTHPSLQARQAGTIISDGSAVEQAKYDCQIFANNDNVTCFPPAGEQVYQHQWAAVVWNSRRPQLTSTGQVNLYLFNADTQEPLFSVFNITNPIGTAGEYNILVNDSWFGEMGSTWQPGSNLSYPFYWIITDQNGLNGAQTTNPTFSAIQTTYADSIFSTMVASSASLSSLSTQSTQSVRSSLSTASIASLLNSSTSSGSIQPPQTGTTFPHWGIAVIVVLGFFAIVASGVLFWACFRRVRRRGAQTNRGSASSASPIMADAHHPHSPKLPLLVGAAPAGAVGRTSSEQHRPPSVVSPDGVSEVSRAHSAGDSAPFFSGADAAIMADAFRKALRKPDFAGSPVEEHDERKDDVMNRELAEEGRDIRRVDSSRGVRVETLSDTAAPMEDQ